MLSLPIFTGSSSGATPREDDFVFDSEVFAAEFAVMPEPKSHEVLGEDHFYRGEETTVATRVAAWLEAL